MLHSKTQADEKLTHISKAPPQMAGLQLKKPELLPAQFNGKISQFGKKAILVSRLKKTLMGICCRTCKRFIL
ncbi:hypothetical protein YQE_05861, partial [Dendroctonus ponderosae]